MQESANINKNGTSKVVFEKADGFLVKFFKRKKEDVFADCLISTLVVIAVFVIFFNIL